MAASHQAVNKLPEFEEVWEAYPDQGQSDLLKSLGQDKNGPWRRDECSALMVSVALTEAGYTLPRTFVHKPDELKSAGGKNLCVDVADLVATLKQHVGQGKNIQDQGKVAGQKGIILFEGVDSIKDQTGHIDLFNGTITKGTEYFSEAEKVTFWELA